MKPTASLSLDLDNEWSYLKTYGDPGWETYPSYLDLLVPRTLDFFRARGLTITYFVVGQDAALKKNHASLAAIARAGHEIACHSFRHEPWLHLYTDAEIDAELARAEQAIHTATGVTPIGFRGPGFSFSAALFRTLQARGYLYDTSTLPTFLGPLARAYYFAQARLTPTERKKRAALFGSLRDGLRPIQPYGWKLAVAGAQDDSELLEIPVTTLPVLRLPFHLSYVLYLSSYSRQIAQLYFRFALALCRGLGVEPSILLHPLDFLGADDIEGLRFFPGMHMSGAAKRYCVEECLNLLQADFEVVPLREHAQRICKRDSEHHLKRVSPP